MADTSASSSADAERRKRRRISSNLPNKVQITTSKWLHNNRLYSVQPARQQGEKVEALHNLDELVVLQVLNRGCRRYLASLEGTQNSPCRTTHAYYVGIEGTEFCPVFLCRGRFIDTSNSFSKSEYALGRSKKAGSFVVPPCDVLRWPQMRFFKEHMYGVSNTWTRDVSETEYSEYKLQQSDNVEKGRACSVLIDDYNERPSYTSLPNTRPQNWQGFRMMMPKIAGKSISDALGHEVASFLAKYARDVVDLSFAISMAIVWCRLVSTPGYQPERCTVDSNGEGRRPVPRPTLAVFLLYAPHFFRFHEEHGLAAYVHIFRYTHSLYAADADHDEDAFYIAKTDINQSKILQIVGDLHLQEEDWLEIVPPSFEGSLLTMPNHYGHIAPRSEETTASLMLPDVYTLGLPDYRNNKMKGHGLVTRDILAHKRWVPSHVLSDGAVTKKYKGRKYLKISALRRYSDDKCPQLWISPKLTVQMPWFDVDPPKYSVLPQPQPLRGAGPEPSGQTQQPPSTMIPKEPIAEFSQKLVVQFRIAQNKGLISPNVCLGDSGLVWEGMQEEIKCARGLHSDISIDQMVAADAAVQANLLTENDQSLLHRLLADLEGDSGVPRCLRPFKNAIDPFEEAPTKTSIAALIQEMGQSAETAMNRITEFGNGDQQGEPAFVKHIMKPCCMLLDIDYPGTPVEGHRAIVQSDLDVGMAVSAIMYLRMLPDTGDLRDAVQKLKCSSRFKPTWRFLLFKDKLSGIGFDEERKHLWQKAFGEPFERV